MPEPVSPPVNGQIGNLLKVYIDPGHGGADGGTSGNGLVEKELNLTISMYQRQFFEEAGYTVKWNNMETQINPYSKEF